MNEWLFVQQLIIAAAIGALIGIERQIVKRQTLIGLRTFALISLTGFLSVEVAEQLAAPAIVVVGFVGVIAFSLWFHYFKMSTARAAGLTTEFAIPLTYILGMLVAMGLVFQAVAAALVITLLLVAKRQLHGWVAKLHTREILDAVEFGIIAFLIWPLLPDQPLKFAGILIDLKQFWLMVIFVSLISFISFVGLHFFGPRSIRAISLLDGVIDSSAHIVTFAARLKQQAAAFAMSWSLANAGMLLRNLALIAVGSLATLHLTAGPILAMTAVFLVYAARQRYGQVAMEWKHPFAVKFALQFGFVFLAMLIAIQFLLAYGRGVVLVGAFLGGIISSASVSASLAIALLSGSVGADEAAIGVVLASFSSLLANLLYARIFGSSQLARRVAVPLLLAMAAGAAVLAAVVMA